MPESLHCHICVLQFKLLYFYCLFKMFSEVKLSMQSIILKFTLWNATFEVFETLPPNHLFGKHNVCSYDKGKGDCAGKLKKTLFYFMVYVLLCVREEEMRYIMSVLKWNQFTDKYESSSIFSCTYCIEINVVLRKTCWSDWRVTSGRMRLYLLSTRCAMKSFFNIRK